MPNIQDFQSVLADVKIPNAGLITGDVEIYTAVQDTIITDIIFFFENVNFRTGTNNVNTFKFGTTSFQSTLTQSAITPHTLNIHSASAGGAGNGAAEYINKPLLTGQKLYAVFSAVSDLPDVTYRFLVLGFNI